MVTRNSFRVNTQSSSLRRNYSSIDSQLNDWKTIFQFLMSHNLTRNDNIPPQRIPLSALPHSVTKLYFNRLREFYNFVYSALKTDEQKFLWRHFLKEDICFLSSLKMTLEGFIFSTFRLSILMDKKAILQNNLVEPELKDLITSGNWSNLDFYHSTFSPRVFRFPDPPMSLIAPIFLKEGELPFNIFLEALLIGDYPYGLAVIPSDPTFVHGGTITAPGLFYSHDILHWPVFDKLVNKYPYRWTRLRRSLRKLYLRNAKNDEVLNYFIFMILHEGILADKFGKNSTNFDTEKDIKFLLKQIVSEMAIRIDYHRTFLKNFFLAKLQAVLEKPLKLYAADEIDEQRLDVLFYKRLAKDTYAVNVALKSRSKKTMEIDCIVNAKATEEKFFCECSISNINVTFISPKLENQESEIKKRLSGAAIVKDARYFFYFDVKDHIEIFKRLAGFTSKSDPYSSFLPWVKVEVKRLLSEYILHDV
ncbi:hypothetical protein IM40_02470 [Candidatus Paracaedimonas acanthamoebae]|nr:hypothetical protein IM40_02470 [Candidatus Paracaedimonas acanthamoebae]